MGRLGPGGGEFRLSPYLERYLRQLARWAPEESREDLVAEARRHLFDAARREEGRGLSPPEAEREAVRQFGRAWRIGMEARRAERGPWGLPRGGGRKTTR